MRKRASLFGVNAPDPHLLAGTTAAPVIVPNYTAGDSDYSFVHDTGHVDLDTVYADIAPAATDTAPDFATTPEAFSWLILSHTARSLISTPPVGIGILEPMRQFGIAAIRSEVQQRAAAGISAATGIGAGAIGFGPGLTSIARRPTLVRQLYRVMSAADHAPLRYTLSAKATGLLLDTDTGLAAFVHDTRGTTAFVQSEPLVVPEQPIVDAFEGHALGPGMLTPVAGSGMTVLGGGMLAAGQKLAVIGKRVRLQFGDDAARDAGRARRPDADRLGQGRCVSGRRLSAGRDASGALAWQRSHDEGVPATLDRAPTGDHPDPRRQGRRRDQRGRR